MTDDVFTSPHTTDWHRQLAEANTILLTQVGSGLHGVTVSGNPTALMPFFAPAAEIVRLDWPGHELRQNRDMLLSRQAGERFLGYLRRQRACMTGELSQRTNRPELVEKYGYDSKYAYHALRLAIQGAELMDTGIITLPMDPEHRAFLLDVRQGRYTKEQVLDKLDRLELALIAATEESDLPERPDPERINGWLSRIHRRVVACTRPVKRCCRDPCRGRGAAGALASGPRPHRPALLRAARPRRVGTGGHRVEVHFVRTFEATYGETPIRYLTRRRIARAQDLLRVANLTVTEVCMAVGFASLGSFSSRLTQLVGESPTAYRERWAARGSPHVPGCFLFMRGVLNHAETAGSARLVEQSRRSEVARSDVSSVSA